MADPSKKMNVSGTKPLSMQKSEFLQRFSPTQLSNIIQDHQKKNGGKSEINLGLSLGGIYSNEKPLSRSSSIIGMMTLKKDDDDDDNDAKEHHDSSSSLPKSFLSLSRSCSVPTEAEQEQRKATMLALARRRRFDQSAEFFMRQTIPKGIINVQQEEESKLAAWAAASAAKSPALCRALVQINRQVSLYGSRNFDGQDSLVAENNTVRSQSSPTQDSESKLIPGVNENGKSVRFAEQPTLGNSSKKAKHLNNGFQDRGMDVMNQMPSVTTAGDGPNGRKIEGFLYKYRKGQVSIVCVCHGSFLSPAEFVRHAGGKDVANPMKQITVSSFSF